MKPSKLAAFLGSISLTISSATAQSQLGVDPYTFSSYSIGYNLAGDTFGYLFQVFAPVEVVGLAALDDNAPGGLTQNVPVGLWTESGTLLDSATIPAGTLPTLGRLGSGLFAQIGIAPITLQPGIYDVGAVTGGYLTPMPYAGGDIAFLTGTYGASAGGLTFPGTDWGFADYGMFGGNIVVSSVPEPCILSLACVGAVGWLACLRKFHQ